MPNKNYLRGAYYERKAQKLLGIPSIRSAGSHGTFDIIGYSGSIIRLVQCKTSKRKGPLTFSPYKEEIASIAQEEVPLCATKELWIFGDSQLIKVWIT